MLVSLLQANVVSFFVTSKYKKIQNINKIDKNSWYWQRNSSYLLNNFKNLNEIFRKDVTYNTKVHNIIIKVHIILKFRDDVTYDSMKKSQKINVLPSLQKINSWENHRVSNWPSSSFFRVNMAKFINKDTRKMSIKLF